MELENNIKSFQYGKITKADCSSSGKTCSKPFCNVKPMNRFLSFMNFGCDLKKSVSKVSVRFQQLVYLNFKIKNTSQKMSLSHFLKFRKNSLTGWVWSDLSTYFCRFLSIRFHWHHMKSLFLFFDKYRSITSSGTKSLSVTFAKLLTCKIWVFATSLITSNCWR